MSESIDIAVVRIVLFVFENFRMIVESYCSSLSLAIYTKRFYCDELGAQRSAIIRAEMVFLENLAVILNSLLVFLEVS